MLTNNTNDLNQISAKEVEELKSLLAEPPESTGEVYSKWVGSVVAKEVRPFLESALPLLLTCNLYLMALAGIPEECKGIQHRFICLPGEECAGRLAPDIRAVPEQRS